MSPDASSTALLKPQGELRNLNGIKSYTAHWDRDSSKDTEGHMQARTEAYTDVVNGSVAKGRRAGMVVRLSRRRQRARPARRLSSLLWETGY